ncbi:hypothetical protein [Amycolatopsis minnesotensis]|uniref:Excreted virulence factor EspC (Type VII ESX diderm) n=1 Tax=Amycolatopsis minnesotensis TaxID=337894 RepID=A0ABP5BGD2_9PSEU
MTDSGTGLKLGKADARAFAVAPDLARTAYQQLSDLQDVVGEMVRYASALGRAVPLGGGYAKEVGEFMARYGVGGVGGVGGAGSAVDSLTAFGRELERLKKNVDKALTRYQDADDAAKDGVDCIGG